MPAEWNAFSGLYNHFDFSSWISSLEDTMVKPRADLFPAGILWQSLSQNLNTATESAVNLRNHITVSYLYNNWCTKEIKNQHVLG